MPQEALRIPVADAPVDSVATLLDRADDARADVAVLLAHGAGAGMEHPFLEAVATGLAARRLPVLRFRYAYTERMAAEGRRRPPDRAPVLQAVHRAALEHLRERFPGAAPILAGKSLGARMSSLLAAQGVECAGLVFLGYPLHPAGRPEKLRKEHFPDIAVPTLFLQGTRDALCDLDLLAPALDTLGAPHRLVVLEDADHGFDVRKKSGFTEEQVIARLVDETARWIDAVAAGATA